MELTSALVCDFASVREGLLFVMGAGVTRIYRERVPEAFAVSLAVMFEGGLAELRLPHEVVVMIRDEDGGQVGQAKGGFQVHGTQAPLKPGEPINVPWILDLRGFMAPKFGSYSIDISVDGEHRRSLHVEVTNVPNPFGRMA